MSGLGGLYGNIRAFYGLAVYADVTDPTVVLSCSIPYDGYTNSNPVSFTATFSQDVYFFIKNNISVINGTVTNFAGSGSVYTFDVIPTAQSRVLVRIPAGSAYDGAGNPSISSGTYAFRYDSIKPVVNLFSSDVADGSFQTRSFYRFRIGITENYSGVLNSSLTSSDLVVTNGFVTGFSGSGNNWTFNIYPSSLIQNELPISVFLPADRFLDLAGNNNEASNLYSFTHQNRLNVNLASSSVSQDAFSNKSIYNFSVSITLVESAFLDSSFVLSDIQVTNGIASSLTGSGTNWSFSITPIAQGLITVSIPEGTLLDEDGILNLSSNLFSFTYDATRPNITLSSSDAQLDLYYNRSSYVFSAQFDEASSGIDYSTFIASDILITNGSASGLTGSGNSWTFVVNPSGEGQITVVVPENKISDRAGNLNTRSNTYSFTHDTISPTPTIGSSDVENQGYQSFANYNFYTTFVEVGSGIQGASFVASDIHVLNGSVSSLVGSGNSWTFVVTPSDQGIVSVNIPAGRISDRAGNLNIQSNTYSFTHDTISPTVWIGSNDLASTSYQNKFNYKFYASFIETGSGINNNSFVASDISVSNGSVSNLIGSANSWTFVVTPSDQGTVSVNIPAGRIQDNAGYSNLESNTIVFSHDTVGPIVNILTPIHSSKNNSLTPKVSFTIVDPGTDKSGVNPLSTYVTINNDFAIYQGTIQTGFDGYLIAQGDGYYGEVQRIEPFDYLTSVTTTVNARDYANNSASSIAHSFITLDNVPPSLVDVFPIDASSQVDPSTLIRFRLRTTPKEVKIDINSLILEASGIATDAYGTPLLDAYGDLLKTTLVAPDELGQSLYDKRVISIVEDPDQLGYSIQIAPLSILPLSGRIDIYILVADLAGNFLDTSFGFTTIDDLAPSLLDILPIPGSLNNASTSAIAFSISDRQDPFIGSGVDLSSLSVKVADVQAIKNGLVQPGFILDVVQNKFISGYNIQIISENLFPPRTTINVEILVSDYNGNTLSSNYFFTTEDNIAPTIIWITPRFEQTGVPLDLPIIFSLKSEVAIQEIDLSTLEVTLNDQLIFKDNIFENGFNGRIYPSSSKDLTFSLDNLSLNLGTTYNLNVTVKDIFQNQLSSTNTFLTTSILDLTTSISPSPGIYSTSSSEIFPIVGTTIEIILSANSSNATIIYTLDGSDPLVDEELNPIGSSQIYSGPLTFLTSEALTVRYRSFELITGKIESEIKTAIFYFTECAEKYQIKDSSLFNEVDYLNIKNKNLIFRQDVLIPDLSITSGVANYIYDLGSSSYIDSLDLQHQGFVRFKARSNNSSSELKLTQWLGEYQDLYSNNLLTKEEGYSSIITFDQQNLVLDIDAYQNLWNNESRLIFNESLQKSFQVSYGLSLDFNQDLYYGSRTGIRLKDDNYDLRIEKYSARASEFENILVGENLEVSFFDGYTITPSDGYLDFSDITDGYEGYVYYYEQETDILETLQLIKTDTILFDQEYLLPTDLVDIFQVISFTDSVYNTFEYSNQVDGLTYTDAYVDKIYYKRFQTNGQVNFSFAASNLPLDLYSATVISENLDQKLDKFVYAETSDFYETELFLEVGDYNYKFYIEELVEGNILKRIQALPFLIKTKQDLQIVQRNDLLIINNSSFVLADPVRALNGEWYFEFLGKSPSFISNNWSITRNGEVNLVGSFDLVIENPTSSSFGLDAEGVVGNFTLNNRQKVYFKYPSKSATSVSLIGTFNRFDNTLNKMTKKADSSQIVKMFDRVYDSYYSNSFASWNRIVIEPELPFVVDRIKFKNCSPDGYQRMRVVFDDKVIDKNVFKAKDAYGNFIEYLNNTDFYVPQNQNIEWNFIKRANEKNNKQRKKFEFWSRFDNGSGTRCHAELEIFSTQESALFVSDFVVSTDYRKLLRTNKTGFASNANKTTFRYGRSKGLANQIDRPINLINNGVLDNFLRAKIIASGTETNTYYVDKGFLFNVGDNVVSSDGSTILRASVVEVLDAISGLMRFSNTLHSSGKLVKDYRFEDVELGWNYNLEVPNYRVELARFIRKISLVTEGTLVEFELSDDLDPNLLLGGRFSYPLLEESAEVLRVEKYTDEDGLTKLFSLLIDKQINYIHLSLAAVVEIFNSTKIVTDFFINKNDSTIVCTNQSFLCLDDTSFNYKTLEATYPRPLKTTIVTCDAYSIAELQAVVDNPTITLASLDRVKLTFFNGYDSRAPSSVDFIINDSYSFSTNLESARIIDGYLDGLYDQNYKETGQIVSFEIDLTSTLSSIAGPFEKIKASFTGNNIYHIGELTLSTSSYFSSSILNVVLNDEIIYKDPTPFSRYKKDNYKVDFTKSVLMIEVNNKKIFQYSIPLTRPTIEFFANSQNQGDKAIATFYSPTIQTYLTDSSSKLNLVGRYLEIEGEILNI